MNVTQQGIIVLLRSAVTGEKFPLPEGFDIEEAYALIKRHHMITLAYDGAVRCGLPKQHPVMRKLFSGYCRAMQISEGQMREVGRVCDAFEEKGIDYMLLKGSKMKALYPNPELRIMGDADILIRMEQYGEIVRIMESLNFSAQKGADHELVWKNDSLYLELHKQLVPSCDKDLYAYFGDGWRFAREKTGMRHCMTEEDEFIFLVAHFAKHYRDGGIGCRHVVDLWVYLRSNPDLDEKYIRGELEKLGLLTFYENVRRLIAVWFDAAQTDGKVEFISEFIFASGSWGLDETAVLSRAVRDCAGSSAGSGGKLAYIRRTLFPNLTVMRCQYPVLRKVRWLLPFAWVVRWIEKLFQGRKMLRRQRKRMQVVSAENVKTRQQALEYVGLGYNF